MAGTIKELLLPQHLWVILLALTWLSLAGLLASIARLLLTRRFEAYPILQPLSN